MKLTIASCILAASLTEAFVVRHFTHVQQCFTIRADLFRWPGSSRGRKVLVSKELECESYKPSPLFFHHAAIKTRDIELAIKFYSLLGFELETKFRAGPARAAWLTNSPEVHGTEGRKGRTNVSARLELLEVPPHMLQEKEGTRKRAIDFMVNASMLGLNHIALDVTDNINKLGNKENVGLDEFLVQVNAESLRKFGKNVRIAMNPKQKIIGNQVYELAFIYDADGSIIEILRYIKDLEQSVQSGWEQWDGTGFIGPSSIEL